MKAISSFVPNYNPEILYVLLDKNSGMRFLEQYDNKGMIVNPGPGTVVNQAVVTSDGDQEFEFYMVSNNNPSTATALPVQYQVVFNTSDLSKSSIEEFTYHQAYGYYGFTGPVKTPASVKYAEKLANYAKLAGFKGKNANDVPNPALANYLHFL